MTAETSDINVPSEVQARPIMFYIRLLSIHVRTYVFIFFFGVGVVDIRASGCRNAGFVAAWSTGYDSVSLLNGCSCVVLEENATVLIVNRQPLKAILVTFKSLDAFTAAILPTTLNCRPILLTLHNK